jgi:hypothetical protein
MRTDIRHALIGAILLTAFGLLVASTPRPWPFSNATFWEGTFLGPLLLASVLLARAMDAGRLVLQVWLASFVAISLILLTNGALLHGAPWISASASRLQTAIDGAILLASVAAASMLLGCSIFRNSLAAAGAMVITMVLIAIFSRLQFGMDAQFDDSVVQSRMLVLVIWIVISVVHGLMTRRWSRRGNTPSGAD